MSIEDPIALMFGGMEKLGPGSDAETLRLLRALPRDRFDLVVDAGCGAGRQTLVLARALGAPVQAVDIDARFLAMLERRAAAAGLAQLVQVHCMDMAQIPQHFSAIDLLWSEGAAYNMGFDAALAAWHGAVRPGGFVVVSELAWLRDDAPEAARAFFGEAYPAMRHTDANAAVAAQAGYRVRDTCTLAAEAWTDGYYDVLAPRAQALASHADETVRAFARETLREVEVFAQSAGSYGYVFYVLERP